MKKTLLSLFAMALVLAVNAQTEVLFDFDNNATAIFGIEGRSSGSGASAVTDGDILTPASGTIDGVTLTVTEAAEGVSTPNRLWATSPTLRMYSGTMTISAPGKKITSIVFTAPTWDKSGKGSSFDSGSYDTGTKTWSASEDVSSVVLTIASNTQMKNLTVTVVDQGTVVVNKPVASVASGTYNEAFNVELTAEAGADIYYQLDGAGYSKYAAPVEISKSCTLEAYAEKGGVKSDVAKFEYVIQQLTGMKLSEAIAQEKGATVLINEEMVVIYKSGQYTYVNADNAWGLIYGTTEYNAGDVIPAGLKGTIDIYNNLVEIKPTECPASVATANIPSPIEVSDPASLTVADANKYVIFRNASVDVEAKTLTANGGSVVLYKRFNECPLPEASGSFEEVLGFVSVFKETIQLYPTAFNSTSTVINAVANAEKSNAPVVNIAGQKVNDSFKGLVIMNGKTVVRK